MRLPKCIEPPSMPDVASPEDPCALAANDCGRQSINPAGRGGKLRLVLDADADLRASMSGLAAVKAYAPRPRPILAHDPDSPLDHDIAPLNGSMDAGGDAAIDKGLALLRSEDVKDVIPGAGSRGRRLRGI